MHTIVTALIAPALLGGLTATLLGFAGDQFDISTRGLSGLPKTVFLASVAFNAFRSAGKLHQNLQQREFVIE